jgi:hypothetical protein
MLDTRVLRRNKNDSYWPIGVYESSLMCVLLKVSEASLSNWYVRRVISAYDRIVRAATNILRWHRSQSSHLWRSR